MKCIAPAIPRVSTTGLILAGGTSRRMNGRDKAWIKLAGRPMICHLLDRFAPQVEKMVISANRHAWAYRRLGLTTVADLPEWQGRGPLAAIAGACRWLDTPRVAIIAVDMPLIPTDWVARLSPALDEGASAAAVFDGRRRQPLCLLLDARVLPSASAAVSDTPMPSMQTWLESLRTTWVELSSTHEHAFANLNTQADVACIEAVLDR